jgi:hypothetical protein
MTNGFAAVWTMASLAALDRMVAAVAEPALNASRPWTSNPAKQKVVIDARARPNLAVLALKVLSRMDHARIRNRDVLQRGVGETGAVFLHGGSLD